MSEHETSLVSDDQQRALENCIVAWIAEQAGHTGSKQTERAYKTTITRFREALQASGHDLTSDATLITIAARRWANAGQDGSEVSEATFNQRIAILSSFYRYAMIWRLCTVNPIDTVKRRPRITHDAATPLEIPEIAAYLTAIDRETLEGQRDYALLSVALTTGRRVSELAGLRWAHLRFVGKKIIVTWVHCKGGKVMTDELKPKTVAALMDYLKEVYKSQLGSLPSDAPIWISLSTNNHHGAISSQTIADICKRRIGTSKVHTLRHSFAVSMEKAGASLSDIGDRLGHNDLKTTSDYMKQLHSAENPYASKLEMMFGI